MMTKGKDMEHFLFRLQSIRYQLTATGAKVEDDVMVRHALNAVTDECETFVQSILGRADLPDWDSLWERRFSLGIKEAVGKEEEGSI